MKYMGIVQNADCRDGICFFGLAELYYETSWIRCNPVVCTVHIYIVFNAYNKCSVTLCYNISLNVNLPL
jgi:hypothetical protein